MHKKPVGKCFVCKKDLFDEKNNNWVKIPGTKNLSCIHHHGIEKFFDEDYWKKTVDQIKKEEAKEEPKDVKSDEAGISMEPISSK